MSETRTGFKITRTDGSTHNGYRWPLPMPGERVRVEATNPLSGADLSGAYGRDDWDVLVERGALR